jgi:hypothetical protein
MKTPRTNSNAGYYYGHGIKKNADLVIDPNGPFVLADFARELERENHALREAGGLMRAWIGNDDKTITERWDSVLANNADDPHPKVKP